MFKKDLMSAIEKMGGTEDAIGYCVNEINQMFNVWKFIYSFESRTLGTLIDG